MRVDTDNVLSDLDSQLCCHITEADVLDSRYYLYFTSYL